MNPMIFVSCPDSNTPCGGTKKLYRHVDILNDNGFDATILHTGRTFRCTWFDNSTRTSYLRDVQIRPSDYVVLPETYERHFVNRNSWTFKRDRMGKRRLTKSNANRIIFNQSGYCTFSAHSYCDPQLTTMYTQPNTVGVIVVSQDSEHYLKLAFPDLSVFRVRNSVNPDKFYFSAEKKKQIAFMPRKNTQDIDQVISILRLRGNLNDFEFIPIDGVPEESVGEILRESLIFLSFGNIEGFSLPPAEAMACGCIAIGYHGMGGREYFKPEFSYPVENGDIAKFVETIEEVIRVYRVDSSNVLRNTEIASKFIKMNYSPENETRDVVTLWNDILSDRHVSADAA